MKKYTLTNEHRVQMKPWADKWIKNAMSTKPMDNEDRAAMITALKGQYEAANLPWHGRVVFVSSPFVARFAAGFAACIWYLRKTYGRDATDAAIDAATSDATYAATDDATYAAIDDAIDAATYAAIDAATSDATRDAIDAATSDATYAAIDDATRAATYAAIDAATYAAIDAVIVAATDAATDDATYAAIVDATRDATYAATDLSKWVVANCDWLALATSLKVGLLGLRCAQRACYMWRGGNQWSSWAAYVSFFRHIAGLGESHDVDYSKWEHWEKGAIHAGPQYLHAEFCIVSDRPRILKVDDQNRPHCEDGPFCAWSDGSMLFSVHGVRVPAWIILQPETITVAKIEAEANAEIRRVMVGKYGLARYLLDAGAEEVSRDATGILYRKNQAGDEPLTMVKVINSTAEPDGTFREYFLRVHPELTPLPPAEFTPDQQAEWFRCTTPQALTAHNAAASTFGMRGEDYQLTMES